MNTRSLRACGLAALIFVVVVMNLPARGQAQSTTSPDALSALLVEVRGLRAAMEQMASAGPRVQLAMGRLQLQEQRVNTMLRRLDDLRDRVSSEEQALMSLQQDASRMHDAGQKTSDPNERRVMEEQAERMKQHVEHATIRLQRLRTEQSETAASVAAEQSRWVEINQRLEDLERALGKR